MQRTRLKSTKLEHFYIPFPISTNPLLKILQPVLKYRSRYLSFFKSYSDSPIRIPPSS